MEYKKEISQDINLLYKNRHDAEYAKIYLYDYVLYNIYSPAILSEIEKQNRTLPSYVRKSIPEQIQELADSSLPTLAKKHSLDWFYLQEGIRILSAYASCPMPLSENSNAPYKIRNLLSAKGKRRLEDLKRVDDNLGFDLDDVDELNEFSERAFFASNKFMLDLDLFVSFDHLKNVKLFSYPSLTDNLAISMTDGCSNNCRHCAYEAEDKLSHMPYPMLLKLVRQTYERYASPSLYFNSDPMSYHDPIMSADVGDVMKHLTQKGVDIYPYFITKGVDLRTKKYDVAFQKVVECVPVEFSLVLLAGEDIWENKRRMLKTFRLWQSVAKDRRYPKRPILRHLRTEQEEKRAQERRKEENDASLFQHRFFSPISVGRWVDTQRQAGLPQNVEQSGIGFPTHTVVRPNGDMDSISFDRFTGKFYATKMGNILTLSISKNEKIAHHTRKTMSIITRTPVWQMD